MDLTKKKIKPLIGEMLIWGTIIVVCLWSIIPVLFVAISSIKVPKDIFDIPPKIFFQPSLSNYYSMLEVRPIFIKSLGNSAIITLGAMAIVLISCSMAGYAYSRYKFKAYKQSAFTLIAIRLLPPIIISVPLFPILKSAGLVDAHITIIMIYVTMHVSLGTWMMKTFIDLVPIEIEEAARIDGATTLQVFLRITLPNAYPGLMAVSIFFAVYAWNEFMFAYIFSYTNAVTAPVAVAMILRTAMGTDWGILFACTTLQMVPIILFFWAIQRHLIRGMAFGAVKG